jgi:molecular chaperone GrpE
MTKNNSEEFFEFDSEGQESSDASLGSTSVSGDLKAESQKEEGHSVAEAIENAADDVLSKLEQAEAEATRWKDAAARAQAEFGNTKKRLEANQAQAIARAGERIVTALIPVMDDLDMSIAHAKASEDGMAEGLEAIQTKLMSVLANEGVKQIDPLGQPFDHNTAQAVQMVNDTSQPEQTVSQVLQKGYVMGADEKVLRPAMVVVTTSGGA